MTRPGFTTDRPRVICAEDDCGTELICDRRRVAAFIAARWTCGMCQREGSR